MNIVFSSLLDFLFFLIVCKCLFDFKTVLFKTFIPAGKHDYTDAFRTCMCVCVRACECVCVCVCVYVVYVQVLS